MSEQLSKDILNAASASERAEYGIRFNAVVKCARSYSNESTSANLKDWDNAKASLTGMEKDLMDKYDTTEESQSKQFKTQALVLTYLNEEGYKVKKSALSNHIRSGMLKKKDGLFHQKDIDAYALIQLQEESTGENSSGKKSRVLQEQKLREEVGLKREQRLKAEREREILEGKYVLRETVEIDLVGRAAVLDGGIIHTIRAKAASWIAVGGGDQALKSEVVHAMIKDFRELINEYASTEKFEVLFPENGQGV